MKNRVAQLTLRVLFVLLLCVPYAFADRREIRFPVVSGRIAVHPEWIRFARDGQLGFAIEVSSQDSFAHLFSFSVTEGKIIDDFSLKPDFGAGGGSTSSVLLKMHKETGLIVVYGHDSGNIQKVLALASDQAGHLSKLWTISYPAVPANLLPSEEVSFNTDGSKIYVIYTDITRGNPSQSTASTGKQDRRMFSIHSPFVVQPFFAAELPGAASGSVVKRVALLQADNGATIDTVTLPDGGLYDGTILFDDVHNRALALNDQSLYVFAPGSDRLEVESSIGPAPVSPNTGLAMSRDRRFVLSYAGYGSSGNVFYSYDLESKTMRTFAISAKFFPMSNLMTFHPATSALFAPLAGSIYDNPNGSFTVDLTGSRFASILDFMADGSLLHVGDLELPKDNPDGLGPNVITPYNNIVVSATGAIGIVSSHNGHLFTFDTSTGEIVNDELIGIRGLRYIQLLEPLGLLVFDNGNDSLEIVDVNTGPVISDLRLKSDRTIIKGANFLRGARVQINGVDSGIANRNPDNPGHEIILSLGKRDFPRGHEFAVVVTNRDGLGSKPFTFER
jgi:hypothetical protein